MIAVPSPEDPDQAEANRRATATGLNLFSRVIAILVLSLLPILVGYYLDRWLGRWLFVFLGGLACAAIAVVGLLAVAKRANQELLTRRKS